MPVVETTPPSGRQAVAGGGPVEFPPGDPALRPDGPPYRVDPDALHRREVDHQAAVGDRQASDAMAAAANGHLNILLAGKIHRVHHIGDGPAPGDERGALVDKAVVHPTGFLVHRVGGVDQLTSERHPHLVGNFDRAMHLRSPLHCCLSCKSTVTARPAVHVSFACQRHVAGAAGLCDP
jgi:hypothetical protein